MQRKFILDFLTLGAGLAGDTASVVCGVDDGAAAAGGAGGGGADATPPADKPSNAAAPDAAKVAADAQLAIAKEHGFASVEEMKTALAAAKKKPEAPAPAAKKPDAAEAELRARDLVYDGVLEAPKGETPEEIAAGAEVLRAKAGRFATPGDCLDTCGTGGDARGTLNISTAAAIVLAACGVRVSFGCCVARAPNALPSTRRCRARQRTSSS